MAAMDKIDRKILAVLQADARASLQEIGQAVGLSPSPCWGRIKKMEEAGVIQGYTVRINPQALDADSIDPDVLAREKAVLADKHAGKPANVIEKIVDSGLKTYYKERDGRIRLQPANPEFPPIMVDECEIQGIVVGVLRRY